MATWDLFREFDRMHRELERLFDDLTGRAWTFPFTRFSFLPGRSARMYPLVNISEDRDNLYVEALAPGIVPESLEVKVSGNQLTIAGEKNHRLDSIAPENVHRNERAAGRFVRIIELNTPVDEAKVSAEYRNGILTITLPKAESAKPRRIEVKVG